MDVQSPVFWDPGALREELIRVSDVCNSCRLCFKFCPSFPTLFAAVDDRHDGDVKALTDSELQEVVDLCFQCKLCYVNCPYTPDQKHPFQIDFPRLMLREKMVRTRARGVALQDRFLGNPDLAGAIGGLTAPFSNWANRVPLTRRILERIVGIHHRRMLPTFHRVSFDRWFRRREKRFARRVAGGGGKVALFYTCSVNYNNPGIGKRAVGVLMRNDIKVVCPEQRCCGMPYLDGGDLAGFLENLRHNVRSMLRFVEDGYTPVALGPTCGYVLKNDYPWIDPSPQTRSVAEATVDIGEYLMALHSRGALDTRFQAPPRRILYHLPCHLKAQNIGFKSRDLLKLIPGAEVEMVDRCSGMDGTWGMKKQYFDASRKVAAPIFRRAEEMKPDRIVSDCTLAGLQIRQGTGQAVQHPIDLLHEAYGLGEEPV